MSEEMSNYIEDLQGQLKESSSQLQDISAAQSQSMFAQAQDSNLIMWQLELDNILERLEHLFRGDELETNAQGETVWITPEDDELRLLNDYGVKLVMNVLSSYLNRNTILSHYDKDRIYEILFDLGNELADLFYNSYDKMGLDNNQKQARYVPLILSTLNTIESAYRRSLFGGERNSLRSARVVTQSDNSQQQYNGNGNQGSRGGFNIFKPNTY